VDKRDFLHKLKGLRVPEAAGQGLFLKGSKTGQKIGCVQVDRFRTFDPVDMHGLVHSAGSVCWQTGPGGAVGAARFSDHRQIGVRLQLRSCRCSRLGGVTEAEIFFFGQAGLFKKVVRFTTKSLYTE
jgi:hypothetical protein